jgi:hypothetical protein
MFILEVLIANNSVFSLWDIYLVVLKYNYPQKSLKDFIRIFKYFFQAIFAAYYVLPRL